MKLSNLLLSGLVFLLIGCGSTGDLPQYSGEGKNQDITSSVIPPLAQGIGLDYNITSYFFPFETLNDGYAYKNYLVTTTDVNGYMTEQRTIVEHYLEGNENGSGGTNISVFDNNQLIKKSIINSNSIAVYTYDNVGNQTTEEQYAQLIRVNEDLIRNENGACVLKEQLVSLDLGDIIPVQANPNSVATSHYNNVLHFYCGTSTSIKIDRYYADGYGEVAEIYHYADSSIGYSVFNKNTDQNP